jgi:hypothetical protein
MEVLLKALQNKGNLGWGQSGKVRYSLRDLKFSRRRVWCSELSSGIYCRVKWLSTDVSEVRTASIIRDEWCSELSSGIYCRVKWLSTDVSEVRTASIIRDAFSSILCVQTGSGTHPASCPMGTGGPFPGGKARPGRDVDHSPPSSAEVVNE